MHQGRLFATAILLSAAACCVLAAGPAAAPVRPAESMFQGVYYNANNSLARNFTFGRPFTTSDVLAAKIATNIEMNMTASGWDGVYVEITPAMLADNEKKPIGYYAAGYAEGYATAQGTYDNWFNLEVPAIFRDMSTPSRAWLDAHVQYMRENAEKPNASDYWVGVKCRLWQLDGMVQGYNDVRVAFDLPELNFLDMFMINFDFEVFDMMEAVDYVHNVKPTEWVLKQRSLKVRHCSAMIMWGKEDLFMTHNTWSSFETMLRQFKTYAFERTISMSGYPGTIHSGDDFYMLDNGFTVQETTNGNYNKNNFKYVVNTSVSEFIRVMVANMQFDASVGGKAWAETFCEQNSGTYNNQFMIVAMDLFVPMAKKLNPDLLWIVEQMPDRCISANVSGVVQEKGAWVSYNRPYFKEIFEWSGFAARAAEYGNYFTHDECPRARVFRDLLTNQSYNSSLEDVKYVMRYADFQTNKPSWMENCTGAPNDTCNPRWDSTNIIAARGDLNPKDGNWGVMTKFSGVMDLAAIDAKIISWSQYPTMNATIVMGPSTEGTWGEKSSLPPFRFSTSPYPNIPHRGIPDLVLYDWVGSDSVFNVAVTPSPAPTTLAPGETPTPTQWMPTRTPGTAAPTANVLTNFTAFVTDFKSDADFTNKVLNVVVSSVDLAASDLDVVIQNKTDEPNGLTKVDFTFAGNGASDAARLLAGTKPALLEALTGIVALEYSVIPSAPAAAPPKSKSKGWIAGLVIGILIAIALLAAGLWFLTKSKARAGGDYIPVDDRAMSSRV